MQLLSKSDYLVYVTGDSIKKTTKRLGNCDGVWVGFDFHGSFVGHFPYQPDESIRDTVLKLARAKMWRFPNG